MFKLIVSIAYKLKYKLIFGLDRYINITEKKMSISISCAEPKSKCRGTTELQINMGLFSIVTD